MKKIFTLMVGALMSLTMLAGENDLLWDFTETAPGSSPVAANNNANVTLTYASKVNDAAGTNNGLKGIKLDSKGYAYFTKAAVAGKLKLTFGPRKNASECSLKVSTWAGETPAAETEITTTATQTESNTQIVDLTAEQNNIYIQRGASVETVLQKIEFKEETARSFVDFKIEFRDNPYTVLLPESGELPAGVLIENTSYNGGQHGIYGGTITVPVDGPVKFTIGACQYSGTPIAIKKDGVKLLDFSNNAPCGETAGNFAQNVTYTYTGDAATLTFELAGNTYVPYFFAEATEVTPCEVIFKDQAGAELFRVQTIEGTALDTLPDVSLLPLQGETWRFRGWFYTNGKKAHLGDIITGNTTIQAKTTEEEHATVGSVQTYDFTSAIFYPEDHETIEMTGGYYHDASHGWAFKNNEGFSAQVAGNAVIVLEICNYGTFPSAWQATKGAESLGTLNAINEAADGTNEVLRYEGEAATLTFTLESGGENYLHKVTVYNVEDFPEKDESIGYYMVPSGDAAAFILTLAQAEAGDKIFLPNGTYDLGETVLTTISKNNISLIGQSMDGVIIKNAPDAKTESIDKTATLRIAKNVSGTYIQDLTIQNALDYYKNDDGRAVALWDQGTKTVCKNVRLLSYQDTYYSNLQSAVKYFEDCEIHGTVDFICGDGSVYFKNNLLYAEKRKKDGGGQDALTASNAGALDRGYVFEGCTLKSECPVVSFGRAWNYTPQVAFLNTLVDYSAGEFSFTDGNKIERWTKELMNAGAWPVFVEYNTHLADGTVITPDSNIVEFIDPKSNNATQILETVIAAEGAALRTMEYTLGDWAATAKADAEQAVALPVVEEGIFLVENPDGNCFITTGEELTRADLVPGATIRRANARGGFGQPVGEPQGVEDVQQSAAGVQKVMRDGQLIIIRGGMQYNTIGQTIK